MKITFWGVRGTRPAPDRHMLRYGGNTSCVSVEVGAEVLVLDAGTGMHALGAALAGTEKEVFILLTHLHGDHLLGFPFFDPLYEKGRVVHLLSYRKDGHDWSPLSLLDGVHFPRCADALACTYHRVEGDAMDYLREHGFAVTRLMNVKSFSVPATIISTAQRGPLRERPRFAPETLPVGSSAGSAPGSPSDGPGGRWPPPPSSGP